MPHFTVIESRDVEADEKLEKERKNACMPNRG